MSKLQTLHQQLAALQRARQGVRWGAGYAALAVAVLWLLAGVCALDLVFEMSVPQRLIVLALAAIGVVWAFVRYTRPFLGVHETELDMALLVEKRQQIDSDLVAALQFESRERRAGSSAQLETAVIDYVADLGPGLNVFEGFSRAQLVRRALTLGATVVGALTLVALFPTHAAVFFDRLALGHRHYPSDTQIEHLLVNHQHVLSQQRNGTAPDSIKSAQSRPVQFLVRCSGDLPAGGVVKLQNLASGQARKLDLHRLSHDERLARLRLADASLRAALASVDQSVGGAWRNENLMLLKLDAPAAADLLLKAELDRSQLAPALDELAKTIAAWPAAADGSAAYLCELGRMIDSIQYKIHLGDAWTDPAAVEMIPLPTVEPRLEVVPPKYARRDKFVQDAGSRHLSVLEGSAVRIAIDVTNQKQLKQAWIVTRLKDQTVKFALQPDAAASSGAAGASGSPAFDSKKRNAAWTLPLAGTPFERIAGETRFEIQVTDVDDLQLETPIQGLIRVKADRPPSGSADVVHRVVLPTAKPVIEYRVNDDYGVGQVTLHMQVERAAAAVAATAIGDDASSSTPSSEPVEARPEEKHAATIRGEGEPLLADALPFVGKYEVGLSPLKLTKGDRLKLTLEIRDYRGELPGETYFSDPLFLEISDEDGVFTAILDADKKADQRLSEIIKRQLGIGETP